VKEFISNEDFNKVLELLGLPGETLEFTVGGRTDAEPMAGVNSSWRMRATIGDMLTPADPYPYQVRVVFVPVFLPADQEHYDALQRQLEDDRLRTKRRYDRDVKHVFLPDVDATIVTDQNGKITSVALSDTQEVIAVADNTGGWCAPTDPLGGNTFDADYRTLVDAALDHAIEVTKPIRGGVDWVQQDSDEKEE
jgi:hypothetical protein